MPGRRIDLPDTIERSPAKAQRTSREAPERAYDEYGGDEARARPGTSTSRVVPR